MKSSVVPLLLMLLLSGCGSELESTSPAAEPLPAADPGPQRSVVLELDHEFEAGPSSGLPSSVRQLQVTPLGADRTPLEPTWSLFPQPTQTLRLPLATAFVQLGFVEESGQVVTLELPVTELKHLWSIPNSPLQPVVFVRHEEGVNRTEGAADYHLLVDGLPVDLRGMGFDYTVEADSNQGNWFSYVSPQIKSAGGNSIRSYGVGWNFKNPTQQAQLISALLTLCKQASTPDKKVILLAGLVFDPAQGNMGTLIPQTVQLVQKDPNFDYLGAWVIGNEIPPAQFPQLNSVINAVKTGTTVSKLARPVATAVPTVSADFVSTLKTQLPTLDWLAINNFYGQYDASHSGGGFLNQQTQNLVQGGWSKPWAITEYYSYDLPADDMPHVNLNGQNYWLELNSTLNAMNYRRSYTLYVASQAAKKAGSVGGLVLNWGPPHNSRLPAFWKMTHVYRGQFKTFVNPPWTGGANFDRLECADAVAEVYGGKLSTNPCPKIVITDGDLQGIACDFKASLTRPNPPKVAPGTQLTARVSATDNDPLTFEWYLIGGTVDNINAPQKDPYNYGAVTSFYLGTGTTSGNVNTITFQAPPGAAAGNVYQLRVVIHDSHGGAATAAVAFPMR